MPNGYQQHIANQKRIKANKIAFPPLPVEVQLKETRAYNKEHWPEAYELYQDTCTLADNFPEIIPELEDWLEFEMQFTVDQINKEIKNA